MTANTQALQSNLKLIRQVLGFTAEKLAEELEVSYNTIVRLENGITTISKIQALAISYYITMLVSDHLIDIDGLKAIDYLIKNVIPVDIRDEIFYEVRRHRISVWRGIQKFTIK